MPYFGGLQLCGKYGIIKLPFPKGRGRMSFMHSKEGVNVKQWMKKAIGFLLNPKFLLCFGIGWLITNGWSYILFALGTLFRIPWMTAVSGAYMALLWFPFTPEKLITLMIAMALLRWLFPRDEKTLGVLREMYARTKAQIRARREKRRAGKSK